MASPPPEALSVLAFWFDPAHTDKWFHSDPAFDAQIREQFGYRVDAAAAGHLNHWAATPSGWLALLIVLDQFPRNIYRNRPRAWRQDLLAQQVVVSGLDEGFDRQLPPIQRVFAYMPLQHAEDIGLQHRCVQLFEDLCDSVAANERDRYTDFLDYARRHASVVARFGRFPHRNAVLGRVTTPEETAYLAEPGSGFS
ncbi:DUF924 family protein [Dyella sp.]|uniref:DUF924 family protein n=1 Tax=Dyella sp. TaxID=1869338 RepID=UPI002C3D357A|nr:DUF924 family protein [Dyella sp.]HTC26958.1 DUF924 family protein [Dyella sp.]